MQRGRVFIVGNYYLRDMKNYTIIYHHHLVEQAQHEWKIELDGQIGFLVLDDLEVDGQNRINDKFFYKYSDYIEWEEN